MTMHFVQQHLFKSIIVLGVLLSLLATGYAQMAATEIAASTSGAHSTTASAKSFNPASTLDENYVIGPDDVLAIDVWHEQELSRTLPVRLDGKIALPLLGEFEASGQTPLQLQGFITQRLKQYLEHPQVTVIVQEPKSHNFNVVGEVQKPGAFVFGHAMTVVDAVALAGGFRDFAKTKKMYVLRTMADGSQHKLPVNYNEVIKGKKPSENIVLEPHDTVVVP